MGSDHHLLRAPHLTLTITLNPTLATLRAPNLTLTVTLAARPGAAMRAPPHTYPNPNPHRYP